MANQYDTSANRARQAKKIVLEEIETEIRESSTVTDSLAEFAPLPEVPGDGVGLRPGASPGTSSGGGTAPPSHDIMGVPNRHPGSSGGFDTIEVRVHGKWRSEQAYTAFQELMDEGQEKAQEKEKTASIEIGSLPALVHKGGYTSGIYFRQKFTCLACDFGFRHQKDFSKKAPQFHIRFSSVGLMQAPAAFIWGRILEFFEEIGFEVQANHVSTAHQCIDMIGTKVSEFDSYAVRDCVDTRARSDSRYRKNRKVTGWTYGKGVQVVVYDKLREMWDKADPFKFDVFIKNRCGGEMPSEATRIEVRVDRKRLVTLQIDSMEDLLEKQAGLAAYMVHCWFRVFEDPVKNGNYSRAVVCDFWKRAVIQFEEVFGKSEPLERVKREKIPDPEKLIHQAAGCIETAAAYMRMTPKDNDDMFIMLESQFSKRFHTMIDRIKEKTDQMRVMDLSEIAIKEVERDPDEGIREKIRDQYMEKILTGR